MLDQPKLSFAATIEALKALGEPTRLRLVHLLASGDLTVSDLTSILGQSQPRISRHLRLLVESGVLTRYQEGAWAYFRLSEALDVLSLVRGVIAGTAAEDGVPARDMDRLRALRQERAERAAAYFAANAAGWDRLRSLHAADAEVEAALVGALGHRPLGDCLDIGTGTGRLIELLAPMAERMVGVDSSREMLEIARAKLDASGITNAQVRQGDCYCLPLPRASFDTVTLHQVLHHLADPAGAVREAAAMLRPAGRLAIVDFAPHDLDFLREEQAHLRLGFSPETLEDYLADAGLEVLERRVLQPADAKAGHLTVLIVLARRPAIGVLAARPPAPAFLETERT